MNLRIFIALFIGIGALFGQQNIVKGKITYLSQETAYVSFGRNDGITDSTVLFVIENSDTIATLKVFGISSKSSVATIVNSVRQLRINDEVVATVPDQNKSADIKAQENDSTITSPLVQSIKQQSTALVSKSFMTVNGRISYQYFSSIQSDAGASFSQPGLVVNFRGLCNNSPLSFNVYGNIRTLSYGTQNLFAFNGKNQTRIYRLSVEYDDSLNRVSVGRIIPAIAPTIGYVDGASYARTLDKFIVGLTAGLEPSFSLQSFSTEMKKFSIFCNYRDDSKFRPSVSIAYSRRYFQAQLDREVVNGSLLATLFEDASLYSQADVELRSKSGKSLRFSPHVAMLMTNLNYKFSSIVLAGLGYNVWKPTYSYSSIQTIPDSLLDNNSRSSLSVNVSFYLSYSISIYNSYLPRSSNDGFGKEYSDNISLSASNIANSGILAQVSMNVNSTTMSSTRGFGAQFQKGFTNIGDISFRYQAYRYNITQTDEITSTQSYALDVMAYLIGNLTLWGSIERQIGFNTNGYTIITELSWRW